MLVAAALAQAFIRPPVVVGGTAQQHWLSETYYATDLDLCPRPTRADEAELWALGFEKQGRHWVRPDLKSAVEFPGSGDDITDERTVEVWVQGEQAKVIGVDDLYLDRLRQSTANEGSREDHTMKTVVGLAVVWGSTLDLAYIKARISRVVAEEPLVGEAVVRQQRLVRRLARRALATERAQQLREQSTSPAPEEPGSGWWR